MLDSIDDSSVPEDFKSFVKAQDLQNDNIAKIVDANPRILFDVFDNHKVYIETTIDELNGFWWRIGELKSTVGYEYRVNAEKAAIEQAFQMLNERL
jgi:hypothetical protein